MGARSGSLLIGLFALLVITLLSTKVETYWRLYSGLNLGAILRTCVSRDPRFNSLNPLSEGDELVEVALPWVDVGLACALRAIAGDRLLRPDAAELTALEHLMIAHPSCVELRPTEKSACDAAHYESVDWLVQAGFDLNGEKYYGGAYLVSAVISKDKDMFAFLLSRGVDPAFVPIARNGRERPPTVLEMLESLSAGAIGNDAGDIAMWREMLSIASDRPQSDGGPKDTGR